MTERDARDRLDEVARAIAAGDPVDWDRVQPDADEASARVLSELKVLDDIAAFHRGVQFGSNETPLAGNGPAAGSGEADPAEWGHLTDLVRIGAGQSGRVYKACDKKLKSEVALKLVPESWRALDEARRLARVRHSHVVLVYGADSIDGFVGLWMELIKGQSLATVLRSTGPFSAREAAGIGVELCGALAAIHAQDLIHGDVKAHNVMRDDRGRIVLMDFGTGKDLKGESGGAQSGDDFAGTPLYLPPEIFAGGQRSRATDIYALGVLLYHLVTGSYPVAGRTRDDVRQAHARRERTYLRDARPDLPEAFVSAVERALADDPRERYETAGAFEMALARCVDRKSDSFWTPRRVLAIAAAAALVAGLVSRGLVRGEGPRRTADAPARSVDTGPEPYRIQTSLYRNLAGQKTRLRAGARIEPGAELFAEVRTSVPLYFYVINEDDRGSSYTLFPMPKQSTTNPVPPGSIVRLPGKQPDGTLLNWVVDQPGRQEHFIIFASPTPLVEYEKIFAALPFPKLGNPVTPLSTDAVSVLRSVGGLASAPAERDGSNAAATAGRLSQQFSTPLSDAEETVSGVWVRQLTIDNPVR